METLNLVIKEITIKIQDFKITPEGIFLFLIVIAGIAMILKSLQKDKNGNP